MTSIKDASEMTTEQAEQVVKRLMKAKEAMDALAAAASNPSVGVGSAFRGHVGYGKMPLATHGPVWGELAKEYKGTWEEYPKTKAKVDDDFDPNTYATPWWVFRGVSKYLDLEFDVDVCASDNNHKVDDYLTEDVDGLNIDWSAYYNVAWCNSPYGRGLIQKWARKCADQGQGMVVVGLINVATDTKWFYEQVWKRAKKIVFVTGRIPFLHPTTGEETGANRYSQCFVVWAPGETEGGRPDVCNITLDELRHLGGEVVGGLTEEERQELELLIKEKA